jgi:hypothetical protein
VKRRIPAGAAEAALGSESSNAVIISLSEVSNLCRRLGEGWPDTENSLGQMEIKSPPGPNLHTGSICSFKRLSILKNPRLKTNTFHSDSKYFYR